MFRIFHEMRTQENPGWFLTLTYEEKYVKRVDDGRLSLRFRDVQLFLKKLRKAKYYAKYICVGEYGSETHRPHYHMLLWTDCPVHSLEKFWTTKSGSTLGRIHVGRLTMASAMYTLKYIIQPKQRAVDGIEKTRAQFSKGLGLAYLTTSAYYYHHPDHPGTTPPELLNFTSVIDGATVALPKYYKDKIFLKWQKREEALRIKTQKELDQRELFDRLLTQGVKQPEQYTYDLRVSQALRIIKSTKYNQTI